MKTIMIKTCITVLALAFCAGVCAQDQQPQPTPDQTQPVPLPDVPGQFQVPQNDGFATNLPPEAVGELLQELMRAREALENATPGENPKTDEGGLRRIRGPSSRGTMGSGSNALPLISIVNKNGNSYNGNGTNNLRLNFRNASLSLVLDYLSDAAGFVISAGSKVDLQGKVTVWSNQPVDRHEAIRLLNAALTSSGYAATVEGNLLNIYVVDATNTEIASGVPNNDYTNIPATKDLITQIVYVHNVESSQLINSLQPLMPTGTSMSPNQGANAIIITDTKANIRRMVQLVKALDTASVSASTVRVFALTYADATQMAQVVQQLFQSDSSSRDRSRFGQIFGGGGFPGFGGDRGGDRGGGGSGGSQNGRMTTAKVTAVADDRSNSLVVSASDEQMVMVEELVKNMDVNVDDIAELRVFRLRHADPQETADQLTTLFPDPNAQQNSSGRSGFRGFGFFGDRGRGDRSSSSSSTSADSRRMKQTRVMAVPDPRTSSVIVSASRDLMQEIAGIIDTLDSDPAKKKKVYVIKVENRDPQELVEDLQSVIATDTSSGNFSTSRNNNSRQSGSQLNTRQQQNLQNQGSSSGNNGFGNSSFGSGQRTGR